MFFRYHENKEAMSDLVEITNLPRQSSRNISHLFPYTMEEVNGSGGSAFGYDDTVYEAEVFVYTSGGKYTTMVSYYQDGKEVDELPTFRNTTAPAAPGTDKENPITGGGPAFPAALTAVVSLGAIAFLWRRRS